MIQPCQSEYAHEGRCVRGWGCRAVCLHRVISDDEANEAIAETYSRGGSL